MLEHINYFIKNITSFHYDIPIYLQIAGFLSIGIFSTCIILIFGDNLNNSVFKDSYMIYYSIVILNIFNIIIILYYYNSKKGKFIGQQGIKGGTGLKGKVGTEINCSLCTHNLYLKKTQEYDTICKLDTSKFLDRLLQNDNNNDNELLNDLFNNDSFNYEQFATSLLIDGFDMNNSTVIQIFNYINAFEFLLYNSINSSIGTSNSNITGYFRRPDVPLGYYSLGDTCMGGSEEYKLTSFAINGDIILPEGFTQLCTFTTINENNNVEPYGIYKVVPPEWTKFEQIDIKPENRDISYKPDKDKYISLGYVIAPLTNSESPDKQLFACIKQSCCRKMKKNSLKFMYIYPSIGFTNNDLNKSNTQNTTTTNTNNTTNTLNTNTTNTNNTTNTTNTNDTDDTNDTNDTNDKLELMESNDDVMGMFSVWRTPYNTLYVKYIDSGKIIERKTIIEQLYLNMNNGEIDESLYTRYGTVKKVIKTRVKVYLEKIKLEKIVILGILFSHIFEKVSKMLKQYYNRYIVSGTKELPNSNKLKQLLTSSYILKYNDIHLVINEIENVLNIRKSELQKIESDKKAEIKKKRILGLGESVNASGKTKSGISYSAVNEFQYIKSTVAELSINVENSENVLDIVNSIFDGGIDYLIEEKELTYAQKIILYICICIIKPNEDIYILRNSCLVYEQIDEERINLQSTIGDKISSFNNLRKLIGTKAESQCGVKNLSVVNSAIDTTYEKLMTQIGHIPNALEKINKLDFEEFTNSQLEYLLTEMTKLILFVENKCS